MDDLYRICARIKEEIDKIAEKGLNTSNLDTAYKLMDMYKDAKNIEYWEAKKEHYESMEGEYAHEGRGEDGYSARGRKRDSRGRYSRDGGGYARDGGYSYDQGGTESYDRYMDSKHAYRANGGGGDCKQRLMNTLDQYMDDFTRQMEEMLRDADCAEERETIKRYLGKLKTLG